MIYIFHHQKTTDISARSSFQPSTRQVYNGPRASNLSQQQQNNFWSKIVFEQQNQKTFPEFFFQKKIWEKNNFEKKFLEKKIEKKFWKKNFENFFLSSYNLS